MSLFLSLDLIFGLLELRLNLEIALLQVEVLLAVSFRITLLSRVRGIVTLRSSEGFAASARMLALRISRPMSVGLAAIVALSGLVLLLGG